MHETVRAYAMALAVAILMACLALAALRLTR